MVQEQSLRDFLLSKYEYKDGELIGPRGNPVGGSKGYKTFTYTRNKVHTRMSVHRAIFLIEKGYLPDLVDHKDQNPRNNLIENLRDADKGISAINIDSFKRSDSALPRGVDRSGNNFTARMKICGKKVHLGTFKTKEEAANAANLRRNEELARRAASRAV